MSPQSSTLHASILGLVFLICGGAAAEEPSPPQRTGEQPSSPPESAPEAPPSEPASRLSERVEALKARADALFRAREYGDAVAIYDQAFGLLPDPRLLYNKGRALQALGRHAEALKTLRLFQDQAPAQLREQLTGFEHLLEDLRQRTTEVRVVVNVAGATVTIGSQLLGSSPLGDTQLVNAGKARLRVEKDGHFPVEREVTLEGGASATFEVVLESKERHAKLIVRSAVPGTSIRVGEQEIGFAPTEVVLEPGSHKVLARRRDYQDATTQVVLEAGQQRTIVLDPLRDAAFYERWWFWGAVGVVTTAAVVTVIAVSNRPSRETEGDFSPSAISAPLVAF
jgi:hypothetical protein